MRSIFSIAAIALLAGCATPYQPSGLSGGFSETQLDANVFRVSFRGNGYTGQERAQEMALLRSAELTLSNGFSYFVIVEDSSRTEYSSVVTPTQYQTTGTLSTYGNTSYLNAQTRTTGGQTFVIASPSVSNTIVCFGDRPKNYSLVYDAQFVYSSLAQKYGLVKVGRQTANDDCTADQRVLVGARWLCRPA